MRRFTFALLTLLGLIVLAPPAQAVDQWPTTQARLNKVLTNHGFVGGELTLLSQYAFGMSRVYDTAARLLADSTQAEGTIAVAIDTHAWYIRLNGAWVQQAPNESVTGNLSVTGTSSFTGTVTANKLTTDGTVVDFTSAHEVALFAKTTGAIKTAVNAQQDFFYAGYPPKYFELAQGVGALGANTLLAANGLTASATGWLLTLDNTATDSLELTEGIVAGSAHSFVSGTDTASCTAVFRVPTRANITHLGFGLRKLAAYETASTAAEWKTAYDDKAMIGIGDNAGTLVTYTSVGGVDTGPTALAHAAAVNADLLALQVNLAASRAVTYKLGTATPAGTTYAQVQTALTAVLAALATDANAAAYSFTAAAVVVPSIIIGASGAGAPDVTLVYYACTK